MGGGFISAGCLLSCSCYGSSNTLIMFKSENSRNNYSRHSHLDAKIIQIIQIICTLRYSPLLQVSIEQKGTTTVLTSPHSNVTTL